LGGLVTTYLALNLVAEEFGSTGVINGFNLMTTQTNDHFHMILKNPSLIIMDSGIVGLMGGMSSVRLGARKKH
jgi:SSS family solute:Na+ symporter